MFLEYSLLILSLPCWCLVSRTYAIPVSSPLYEDKVYSLNKLTYSPNEALPENEDENFGGEEMPPKSRISDFTDSTGFNPFLDLSEGPTSEIRSRLLNATLIPGDNYYKYEGGGKDRHSKRDNDGSYGQTKRPSPAWLLEGEKPRGQRLPVETGSLPSRTGFARGFGSIVEGESGGRDSRDRFWMGAKISKPILTTTTASTTTTSSPNPLEITREDDDLTKTIPEKKNAKKETGKVVEVVSKGLQDVTSNEDDYVTMKVPDRPKDDQGKVKKTKIVKKEMEGMVEIISKGHGGQDDSDNETNENIFVEDGGEKESVEEETNDNVNSIATFLETKSFVYSLALICASVVFFAAVLTGMFVYRKKRRRLPGVHKKGGRFYFATPKNRRGRKDNREKEERILDDDFRVTVC